jgi:cation diffusion facilitator family transporter
VQAISRYAIQSVGVAVIVTLLKAVAWWVTGSIALLSDALESIINVVVAGAAYIALRVSETPPDAKHPFGHHKAEYFSAVLEGALIIVAALAIFREAALHFVNPVQIEAPGLGIAFNVVASVMNAVWGWRLIKVGRRERSPALYADGQHVLADVVTSAGVIIGVLGVVFTGWLQLDSVLAAAVGCYILVQGWGLVKDSVGGLMDQAADPQTQAAIQAAIAKEGEGAIEAHDLQTRHAGPVTFIQFHLVVPGAMTVEKAHEICDRIENSLGDTVPGSRVSIHVEPEDKAKHAGIIMSSAAH